jgi:hypothetical protein
MICNAIPDDRQHDIMVFCSAIFLENFHYLPQSVQAILVILIFKIRPDLWFISMNSETYIDKRMRKQGWNTNVKQIDETKENVALRKITLKQVSNGVGSSVKRKLYY